ncbi:hypothetical protein [Thalassobaculum salexigens]|uniref:hypothetical protein n=1 Tax=Thalassobaculum salexigens TaxID=455360 RepID=UPI00048BD71C|nr:hypothetical protein [Thalassobaculum salexigens]
MERIATLPEDERDAMSEVVLGYVDELVVLRRQLAAAEEHVTAGTHRPRRCRLRPLAREG